MRQPARVRHASLDGTATGDDRLLLLHVHWPTQPSVAQVPHSTPCVPLQLEVPPVVLGYTAAGAQPATLHVHAALRPHLVPPTPAERDPLACGETSEVVRHARRWAAAVSVQPQCQRRQVAAMAVDMRGVGALITRFVAPLMLPPVVANAKVCAWLG